MLRLVRRGTKSKRQNSKCQQCGVFKTIKMDENNSIIYGLESQARALTSQLAENNDVRFFIATQTLKPANQIHLVQLNEDTSTLETKIFSHPMGEIWRLTSNPHDLNILSSCFTVLRGSQVVMNTAILRMAETSDLDQTNEEFRSFQDIEVLDTEQYGKDIRTTEFHPTDANSIASVIDGKIVLFQRTESKTRVVADLNAKNSPKFTIGKWSQHHQGNQFIALYESSIRAYDIRDINHLAWNIDDAHSQLIRDVDCNQNKQCHIVTGSDDGSIKIWDTRNIKESVFCRTDHAHWIWSVRFNTFHDQLILSSSSDCKVILTCAASVSSEVDGEEDDGKDRLPDGLLQTFEQHEDSVYCAEWSSADPWIFASLSYDGRMILSKVPKQYKYQILL